MKLNIFVLLVSFILCGCSHKFFTQEKFKPIELSIGAGFENPIGINLEDTSLSWKLPLLRNGISQSAYQIQISRDDSFKSLVWDSSKIESAKSVRVDNLAPATKSGERLYWRVKVWDELGNESLWSDTAFYEAGLTSTSDWKGMWLTTPEQPHGLYMYKFRQWKEINGERIPYFTPDEKLGVSPMYFRKKFASVSKPVSARLYVTSKGIFKVMLNGKKVGNDLLVQVRQNTQNLLKQIITM